MIRSLWIAKTGLDAQQPNSTSSPTTSPTSAPTASSARARCSRTCCTRQLRQPGAQSSQQTQLPTGLQLGTGVRAGRHRAHLHAGQPAADRQPARRRDQRAGLLPGPDARRHDRLHARRLVPARRQGQLVTSQRLSRCSRRSRFRPTRRPSRSARTAPSSVTQPGSATPTQVGTIQLANFINPAGLQSARREPVRRDGRVGHAARPTRRASTAWASLQPGLRRDLERERGRGAGQHDPDAARLRDQLARRSRPPTRCCRS